jgi:hypothetical protein
MTRGSAALTLICLPSLVLLPRVPNRSTLASG